MSVLKLLFNRSVFQVSPPVVDYQLKVDYDKDQVPIITFPAVDNDKIIESNGSVDMWSLRSMLQAGVDPSSSIRTSSPSRLEGVPEMESLLSEVVSLKSESNETEES